VCFVKEYITHGRICKTNYISLKNLARQRHGIGPAYFVFTGKYINKIIY